MWERQPLTFQQNFKRRLSIHAASGSCSRCTRRRRLWRGHCLVRMSAAFRRRPLQLWLAGDALAHGEPAEEADRALNGYGTVGLAFKGGGLVQDHSRVNRQKKTELLWIEAALGRRRFNSGLKFETGKLFLASNVCLFQSFRQHLFLSTPWVWKVCSERETERVVRVDMWWWVRLWR